MRILFLSDNFPPETNAPASRLFEHAKVWVGAGHDVTVITCAPNFPKGQVFPGYRNRWYSPETVDGIRVVRVKSYITANEGFLKRTLDYVSFAASGFVAGLFQRRPDVVVATSPQFFCAVGGWALAAVRRVPFVFELRDLWPATIKAVGAVKEGFLLRTLERLELFLYRRAAAIIAVTESFGEDLRSRGIGPEQIAVVINGVDLNTFKPRERDPDLARQHHLEGKFVVGYLGTHGMCHGLESVVDAAERVRCREDIAFIFVGGGATRKMVEDQVKTRGLSNVRLIAPQPKEMMPRLWSLCDVALVPLRDDPVFATVIPSKIFECMGMAIPMLMALPEGEATGIIRRTGAGVVVPPEDPEAMAQAVEALADDPQLLARLRRQAYAAASLYSREAQAQRMLAILEAAVAGTPAANVGGATPSPLAAAAEEVQQAGRRQQRAPAQ